ncbi:ATPase AAA [Desulfolithobacter dissulfuricans]|uniref:ATPase AAA n=1 Tax=Desulfolithobacter dissulfuricans TaxID=2795293 RepID=A0A915U8G5_9BACT|nr:IS21-like element helper ATPase IstB [Desulfolithobacter dissulfuricans]BCO07986.1 ATPase AAA [Desulfolithobacter dissulfuricans]
MEQLTSERLQDNLARLKLSRAAEVLDTVVQQAKEEKSSYVAFLDHLLEEEVAAKEKRRIQTAMKTAGLPSAKTIEEYDFSFHPQLDKGSVMELFDLSFITNKENVIFLGPPGVGKTHLAISLAIKACHHGFKVYFTTMDTLIKKLKEGATRQKAYLSSSLVIVDEVGYLPVSTQEAYLFFQFVSHRYERNSTIITSNKSFGDWQELFGDPVIATAILDRLLHHCRVINIKGHSYRLRGTRFQNRFSRNRNRKTRSMIHRL